MLKHQRIQRFFFIEDYIHAADFTVNLYNILYDVDYDYLGGKGKYVADLSFSLMHWMLIESLKKVKIINLIDDYNLRACS